MSERPYTAADLDLFRDLGDAARKAGLTPCLIGAGAIRLGGSLRWNVRLGRRTLDWDFAVRVETWEQFTSLTEALVSKRGRFTRAAEPHRLRHRSGGTLDIVPFGGLEEPPGSILWQDGARMETSGLSVLNHHTELLSLGELEVRTASLPALLGLKLLTYRSRRDQTQRDIEDAYTLLRERGDALSDDEDRIGSEALTRLGSGDVALSELGAYFLGLDVGRVFGAAQVAVLIDLVAEAEVPEARLVRDVLASNAHRGSTREFVVPRLLAFALGLQDAQTAQSSSASG